MIEVELKFRTSDVARVRSQVEQLGGHMEGRIEQVGYLLRAPGPRLRPDR